MTNMIIRNGRYVTDDNLKTLDEVIAETDQAIASTVEKWNAKKRGCLDSISRLYWDSCPELDSCRKAHGVTDCEDCNTLGSCFIEAEAKEQLCAHCTLGDLVYDIDADGYFCIHGENHWKKKFDLECRKKRLLEIRDFIDSFERRIV